MIRGKRFILIVALAVTMSCSSCSLFMTKYVPEDYSPSQDLDCTDNNKYVAFDVLAGLGIMGGPSLLIAGSERGMSYDKAVFAPFVVAGSIIILTAALVASGEHIQDCKQAKITRRGWLDRDQLEGGRERSPAQEPLSAPSADNQNDGPDETSPARPTGEAGGTCYGNGTCNSGLECSSRSICEVRAMPAGHRGGACYGNGTCNDGLACEEILNLCFPVATEPQEAEES